MTQRIALPVGGLLVAAALAVGACAPSAAEPTMAPEAAVQPEATVAEPTAEMATAAPADHTVHWSYEGEEGPEHWAELSPANAACGSGAAQSPIDLANATEADLANITFDYQPSNINILNNGHTIQVNADPGSGIELDGKRFELLQFHLHAPAEHSVGGQLSAAELHLVHQADDGQLAVVGLLIDEGAEHPAFASTWANLPAEESEVHTVEGTVDMAAMLPASHVTYRYDGSLTTPPCTEGVKWNVMATPIELSPEQLAAFTAIFTGNNRPVQSLGDRQLVEDSTP
jgi:carbonic anhydrase